MLNRNGKMFFRNYGTSVTSLYLKGTSGSTEVQYMPNTVGCYGIRLGTGDAEVSADDYNLASQTNELTEVSQTQSYGDGWSDNYIAVYTGVFKNNTDHDVNIKEVGVFYYDTYYTNPSPYMIARQVISTKTVHPGETYAFSMTVG